ncbi:MAG: SpoIID/LytB domain-containing protein [Caldiserica bacterium]|nr:SpoIID/LytB domain-containing protein [Caldisericota bacterium]MDH7562944.1 SpoIID/LytB domain-containing protein [Caldisericota bacterium]
MNNRKALILLLVISLILSIPLASAQEAPEIRVLLSKNPSPCEISSEETFRVNFLASGSSLSFLAQESITISPAPSSHLVFLKETSLDDASSIAGDHPEFFQATGKPLAGEINGRTGLFLGPFASLGEAQNAMNASQGNFPQATIIYSQFVLKGQTPDPYDIIWGGESSGKALQFSSQGTVKFNGRRYRGSISLFANSGENAWELWALNELDLESYLCGVVPAEMPFEWPLEALKAQAVASRTYALKRIFEGQTSVLPYDVNATVSDQVYKGFEAEKDSANQAVWETSGEVLKYEGDLITPAFHSCSGGHTENNENVWKGPAVPYLRGVPSPGEEGSKFFSWTRTVTLNFMAQKIEELKKETVGEIVSLEVVERGVSGRIKILKVTGSTGTCTLSGEELRKVADLPSALVNWEGQEERTFSLLSFSGIEESSIDQSFALSSWGTSQLPSKVAILSKGGLVEEEIIPQVVSFITFHGNGWGHGVGMSQWGAKARADEGKSYREILAFYYQGITIEKEY